MKKLLRVEHFYERGFVRNRTTLYRWIHKEGFPSGFLLGPNTRVWTEDEVEEWLASRPHRRQVPPSLLRASEEHEPKALCAGADARGSEPQTNAADDTERVPGTDGRRPRSKRARSATPGDAP